MLGWKEAIVGQVPGIRDVGGGGAASQSGQHACFRTQLPQVRFPEFLNLSMLQRSIYADALKKLDSGMKMSIKPYLVLGIGKLEVYKKMWRWPRHG